MGELAAVIPFPRREPDPVEIAIAAEYDRGLAQGIWIGAIGSLVILALIFALAWYVDF